MNTLGKTIAIFLGLVVVFVALVLVANNTANSLNQLLLVSLGSAIFGSGLTFFMIRIAGLDTGK